MKSEEKYHHTAKKVLGQNFLKTLKFVYMLVDSSDITPEETVVEVGPGKGVITKLLLERAKRVIAVEKDDNLHERLQVQFADEIASGKLTLVHGDILEFNPSEHDLSAGSYKLIGSIPYYITGILMRMFLTMGQHPRSISFIVQREVAQRVVAQDGKESILSISVKAHGTPKYVHAIKAREFSPQPKVDSAILAIGDISHDFFADLDEEAFFTLVKTGFSSKRKKVVGNLSKRFSKDRLLQIFPELGISPDARAENLSVDDWKNLSQTLL